MTDRLRLRAEEAGDLPALSALVQDMAVKVADIGWQPAARRLALIGNRYRWEERQPTRSRAALRIDFVTRVQRHAWPGDPESVLALLAITAEEAGALTLTFSGGAALRLETEVIEISLDDLSGPWGTRRQPRHKG